MPQEVQSRVFEPFFTTKESGTGLGLCISAQIMAGHQGSLVMESSTQRGTTFAVWIPIAQEAIDGQDTRC
jgi:signal transduction histidine kinase